MEKRRVAPSTWGATLSLKNLSVYLITGISLDPPGRGLSYGRVLHRGRPGRIHSWGEDGSGAGRVLLAVPGVREICKKVKLLFEKHPRDSNEIVRDLIVTLDKEMAFRKERNWAVRSKPK